MLPSILEVEQFIETNLNTKLEALDKKRKFQLITTWIGYLLIPIMVYCFYHYVIKAAQNENTMLPKMLGLVGGVYVLVLLVSWLYNKNTSLPFDVAFKEEVIKPFIQFINPNFQYRSLAHVNQHEFLQCGLFDKTSYDMDGSDQVIGKYNDVLFQFCDLDVSKEPTIKSENEADDQVFYGNFFMAKFNKPFKIDTFLTPNVSLVEDLLGGNFDTEKYVKFDLGEPIKLEDPEFSKLFKVYSRDQIEARYILTPSLMERIKKLQIKTKGVLYISFRNDTIYIANNNGRDNFEPSLTEKVTKKENLLQYYNQLTELISIIDDLKLNIKIWKPIN